jgi:hypothetical protein
MAIIDGRDNHLREIGMVVSSKLHEYAGDGLTRQLNENIFSSKYYVRRHLVLSGSFKTNYPGTDYPDDVGYVGDIWPYDDDKRISTFTVSAMEDNSSYVCFLRNTANTKIEHEKIEVKAGIGFVAKRGRAYVPFTSFSINDNHMQQGKIVPCITSDRLIVPDSDGIIASFWCVHN